MRVFAPTFAYNEGEKIRRTIARHPDDRKYDLLVFDDGSTDGALDDVDRNHVIVLRNETNQGIGSAMKRVFQYSLDQGYDVLAIQAGKEKDDPSQILAVLAPRRFRAALAPPRRRRFRQQAQVSPARRARRPPVGVLNRIGQARHREHERI